MAPKQTTEKFIADMKIIHKGYYSYDKTIYTGQYGLVTIVCPIHGDFEQRAIGHRRGSGCTKCSHKTNSISSFIEKSKKIHSGRYNYSLVEYKNIDSKVIIICDVHGVFEQSPYNHLRGKNCPKCVGNSRSLTTEDFINSVRKIHGEKYDYSASIYRGRKEKLIIICRIHGEFLQSPDQHLNNNGCKLCANCGSGVNLRLTTHEFINRAIKIHGNIYEYKDTNYIRAKEHIVITCKIHGNFRQLPNDHLSGNGCQLCGKVKMVESKAKLGQVRHPSEIPKFEKYRANVWGITNCSWRKYKRIINPMDHKRGVNTYHLDHIYSIQQGFLNNIPEEIVGHYTNLQILTSKENATKLNKCSKTKENLYIDYNSSLLQEWPIDE